MRRPFIAIFISLAAGALVAQNGDKTPDFRGGVDTVVVPATVKAKDQFVNGLELANFRLFDNDHGQNFKLDFTAVPISMVVAVQGDQQVEYFLPKIKTIGPLLENLILGQTGEGALLVFDHRQRVLQDFTNDGKLFTKALDTIRPGSSSSAMIDAVMQGTRMLKNKPTGRRRIILLISETRDRGSEGKLNEALEEAENNNISIYSVNINRLITALTAKPQPPPPDRFPPGSRPTLPGASPTSTGNVSGMGPGLNRGEFMPLIIEGFRQAKSIFVDNTAEAFTKYTGGREYGFKDTKELEHALSDIGEELHSQYLLTYTADKQVQTEAGWHVIKVQAIDKSGRLYEVRARPGYWAAAKFK